MRNRFSREDGVALITAMLAVVILSGMATVFVARAVTEQRASGSSQRFESTIHTAEAAGDVQIAELNAMDDHVTVDRTGAEVTIDPGAVTDEEAWAESLLDRMRDSPAWVSNDRGESYAVRPRDTNTTEPLDVIYSVGATPSFADPNAIVRVVKMQVAQDHFVPDFALLTDGALDFGGNASIVHPACDLTVPETCIADVHVNQTVTNPGNASRIEGQLTIAGGTCPTIDTANGCISDGVQPQPVPPISARSFYLRDDDVLNPDPAGQTVEWFDLCPNGTVRDPSTAGPCQGTQRWPDPSAPGSTFRGWEWRASQNAWKASSLQAGVFYVYRADAQVTGSAGSEQRAVSILVEGDPANPTRTGALSVSGNPRLQAALSDVLFITDRDLDLSGNAQGGTGEACGNSGATFSGFVGVTEQLKVGGTVNLRGAVIVSDDSDDHNLVARNNSGISGTMCLEYDDNLAIDLTGIWVVTFWNEL